MTAMRSFLLGAGGILAVTAGQRYGYPGAGPLACIVSSFVAGTGWKWRVIEQNRCDNPTVLFAGDDDSETVDDPVEKVFERIWFGLQPVLFASIGTEIKFELLAGGDIIVRGMIVLLFGLIVSDLPRYTVYSPATCTGAALSGRVSRKERRQCVTVECCGWRERYGRRSGGATG